MGSYSHSEREGRLRAGHYRQVEGRWVAWVQKIKSGGGRGHAPQTPVATRQNLSCPFNRPLPRTNFYQHTHDISHHVLKESIGFDVHTDQIAGATQR